MITITVPAVWSPERRTGYEVAGSGLLYDVVRRFVEENPVFRRRLIGADGAPLKYVNLFVDDELIMRHLRETTEVAPGSTVTIISPMAGG
ncbi:MoaD/ThiS family protein [Actinophytocola glycyrrhizae]|uniref:MoaD/ThiS family protein n=1 Tax=Actinophytocola glycyrrhizae TaxID=2044873 RepID=A0ABV9SB57_9PSEU